jgi:hypothetical protein
VFFSSVRFLQYDEHLALCCSSPCVRHNPRLGKPVSLNISVFKTFYIVSRSISQCIVPKIVSALLYMKIQFLLEVLRLNLVFIFTRT